MKKIKELLSIPENGNISDAAFLVRMIACFVGMFACMLSLCVVTYALYSYDIGSGANRIQAASFDLEVEITDLSKPDEPPVTGGYDYSLVSGTHKVTLSAVGDASTGYCKIALIDDNGVAYETHFTQQIGKGEVIEFTVTLSEDANIRFSPQWGTYSGEGDILDGGAVSYAH